MQCRTRACIAQLTDILVRVLNMLPLYTRMTRAAHAALYERADAQLSEVRRAASPALRAALTAARR